MGSMADETTIACLVLAGGRSRRMGQDKRALHYKGRSFLNRAVETARSISDEVWLLAGSFSEYVELRSELAHDANVAVDRIPNAGPMSALAGALPHLNVDAALLLSVDYPLLSAAFLWKMIAEYISSSPRPSVLLPESDGHWHVTCALYATSLHPSLVRTVDAGERSLRRWIVSLPDDDVEIVDETTWQQWDARDVLINVNTPTEYRRLMERSDHSGDDTDSPSR